MSGPVCPKTSNVRDASQVLRDYMPFSRYSEDIQQKLKWTYCGNWHGVTLKHFFNKIPYIFYVRYSHFVSLRKEKKTFNNSNYFHFPTNVCIIDCLNNSRKFVNSNYFLGPWEVGVIGSIIYFTSAMEL